jgi:tRNA pseudouridine55 synthase
MTRPGLLLVDKPAGVTSHDVVGRARRVLGTRRIGHAGTLDPLATGLLILGVERGTKLMGPLLGQDKTYLATMRLGATTSTDDAEGTVLTATDASKISDAALTEVLFRFTGQLLQVPSSVSAIKVDGRRAYDRVRSGETVVLAARPVVVSALDLLAVRRQSHTIDLDVEVSCSSGTYIRSLSRDIGETLGVGGHVTALRRTRIGPFSVADACDLFAVEPGSDLDERILDPVTSVASILPLRRASDIEAVDLSYGRSLPAVGISGTYAIVSGDGARLLALVSETEDRARPLLVWHAAG